MVIGWLVCVCVCVVVVCVVVGVVSGGWLVVGVVGGLCGE